MSGCLDTWSKYLGMASSSSLASSLRMVFMKKRSSWETKKTEPLLPGEGSSRRACVCVCVRAYVCVCFAFLRVCTGTHALHAFLAAYQLPHLVAADGPDVV